MRNDGQSLTAIGLSFFIVLLGTIALRVPPFALAGPALDPEKDTAYLIREGDTLWDISRERLQDPFLWPQIWKANPSIANPDLIFPGHALRFPSEESAAETSPPAMSTDHPAMDNRDSAQPGLLTSEGDDTGQTDEEGRPEMEIPTAPYITAPEELRSAPSIPTVIINRDVATSQPRIRQIREGWVTSRLLSQSPVSWGTLIGEPHEKSVLSEGDKTRIKIHAGKPIQAGDRFVLYRPVQSVIHPKTCKPLGNLFDLIGSVMITQRNNQEAQAVLTSMRDFAFPGDLIAPYPIESPDHDPLSLTPTPNRTTGTPASAIIVAVQSGKTLIGQDEVVYLDQGMVNGIKPGRRLSVIRSRVRLGEVLVLEADRHHAAALVIHSQQDLAVGDALVSLNNDPH